MSLDTQSVEAWLHKMESVCQKSTDPTMQRLHDFIEAHFALDADQRDTLFLGFAQSLWQDLLAANGMNYIDCNDWDDPSDTPDYLTVIAQRSYDFARDIAMCLLHVVQQQQEEEGGQT